MLAADHLATPRVDGDREALRVLHVCRRHYSDTRTATVNLFKALILTADDELRGQFRGRSTVRQLQHAATLVRVADCVQHLPCHLPAAPVGQGPP